MSREALSFGEAKWCWLYLPMEDNWFARYVEFWFGA